MRVEHNKNMTVIPGYEKVRYKRCFCEQPGKFGNGLLFLGLRERLLRLNCGIAWGEWA